MTKKKKADRCRKLFENLDVLSYGDRLLQLAARRATNGDFEAAGDVVQQVYTKLLDGAILRYREVEGKSFWSWLSTVALNVCRDHIRRERKKLHPADTGLLELAGDTDSETATSGDSWIRGLWDPRPEYGDALANAPSGTRTEPLDADGMQEVWATRSVSYSDLSERAVDAIGARLWKDHAPDTPESGLVRREVSDRVWRAIESLPGIYQQVVVRVCLEDASREEVADELGIPASTVRVRLKRGKERLAELLREGGE